MIQLFIFDFDGTLADTRQKWLRAFVKILKQENFYCPECEAKLVVHFGSKIKDLLQAIEVEPKRAEHIAEIVHREFLMHSGGIKLCPGFNSLKKIKATKIILSNSPGEVIEKVLWKKLEFFKEIYGAEKFKNKAEEIRKLMKKYKTGKNETAYIGDRAGDVKTARKAGCIGIVISNRYSWNKKEEILRETPDFVIGNLKNILDIRNP